MRAISQKNVEPSFTAAVFNYTECLKMCLNTYRAGGYSTNGFTYISLIYHCTKTPTFRKI